MPFTLYRASAGAGKTHTLVTHYLQLALTAPQAFERILAVTFTNKATQELKQRILHYLQRLAQGDPQILPMVWMQQQGWSQEEVSQRASQVLSHLLHNYARFSVGTLDSFFQTIIRGFAQELGLPNSFQIVMEQEEVLSQTIDKLIASAGQDEQLRAWLVQMATDKLAAGKPWYSKRELMILGRTLLTEGFAQQEQAILQAIDTPQTMWQLRQQLQQTIESFEQHMQHYGQQAMQCLQSQRLDLSDFAYGRLGVMGYLASLAKGSSYMPTQRARVAAQDTTAWYSKQSAKKDRIEVLVENHLQLLLQASLNYYQDHHQAYHTALLSKRLLYAFGITAKLLAHISQYRSKNQALLASDANLLLYQVMADHDASFIYEKIGAYYDHFLIDEFQDLSGFQWHNLKPLIQNSLAEGHSSYIVGDVKQAIYRWRGGDWKLLLRQLEQDLPEAQAAVLDHNWRSKPHIVAFNNTFFQAAAAQLTQMLQADLAEVTDKSLQQDLVAQAHMVQEAYQTAYQQVPATAHEGDLGYVQIQFLEDASQEATWKDAVKERLPKLVEELQRTGFAPHDIAFLVRNHAEEQEIVQTLLAYQQSPQAQSHIRYDTVASDMLCLGHNPCIQLLVQAMKYVLSPNDPLVQATLAHLCHSYYTQPGRATPLATPKADQDWHQALPTGLLEAYDRLRHLPLPALVHTLVHCLSLQSAANLAVLQAFQEALFKFSSESTATLARFISWWEMRGHKTPLATSETAQAMPIMTVHQAKGLQFKVVIVPFCMWSLDHPPQHPPTLWCKSQHAPFHTVPTLPVPYSSQLRYAWFAKEYYQERIQVHLDCLNLLYVAFTRPEDRLYVFAKHAQKPSLKTTSHLMQQVLTSSASMHQQAVKGSHQQRHYLKWSEHWQATAQRLVVGKPRTFTFPQQAAAGDIQPYHQQPYPTINRYDVPISTHSLAPEATQAQRAYGRLLHRLLADIHTVPDLSQALQQLQQQEALTDPQLAQLEKTVQWLWEDDTIRSWFSSDGQVRTEAPILTPTGATFRPDRIMHRRGVTWIIDFKTGQPNAADSKQVSHYMQLLQSMGHSTVKGYLIYTEHRQVVDCS